MLDREIERLLPVRRGDQRMDGNSFHPKADEINFSVSRPYYPPAEKADAVASREIFQSLKIREWIQRH